MAAKSGLKSLKASLGAAGFDAPRRYALGQVSNNARSHIAAAIGADDKQIPINGNDAILFPALRAGEWFPATIYDGEFQEIIYVTARQGSILTVSRGQENTDKRQWAPGTPIDLRLSKGLWDELAYTADGHHRHALGDIDGMSDFPTLTGANSFTGKNTFGGSQPVSFTVSAQFGSTITVSGAASFGGDTTFTGYAWFKKGGVTIQSDDPNNGQWPFISVWLADGTKRGGGLKWNAPNTNEVQLGYSGDGGIYFWRQNAGDFFVIAPDGNFSSQRANSLFGRQGPALDVIKGYIDDKVSGNFIIDIWCQGEWQFDGKRNDTGYGGPWMIMQGWNSGGDGVFGFKRTELWVKTLQGNTYRVGKR